MATTIYTKPNGKKILLWPTCRKNTITMAKISQTTKELIAMFNNLDCISKNWAIPFPNPPGINELTVMKKDTMNRPIENGSKICESAWKPDDSRIFNSE